MFGLVGGRPEERGCRTVWRILRGGDGGVEGVLRGGGGVVNASGGGGGVPMVDMGDVGAVGRRGVFGSLSV